MRQPDYPDTILDPDTTHRLLEAIRAGVIDMAYFPGLYFRSCGQTVDPSLVSPEEDERFMTIIGKIRFDASGQVVLSRGLKMRLLFAVRAGRINLHADFAELAIAYRKVQQDWSTISEEEQEFILDICLRITN